MQQSATFLFGVDQSQSVTVSLFSIAGELVANLYEGSASGFVRLTPNLGRLADGMYIVKIKGEKGLQLQTKIVQH